MDATALGMIETIGLVSAIEAADAGLKAADVHLLGTDYVRGGLVLVRFEGEVAAVKAAVDVGVEAARRIGSVFSSHVIPRAMPEVFCMLACDVGMGPAQRANGGCASCGGCEGGRRECALPLKSNVSAHQNAGLLPPDGIENKKVIALRSYVRGLKNFPLTPNEIRYATRQMLLDAIESHFNIHFKKEE